MSERLDRAIYDAAHEFKSEYGDGVVGLAQSMGKTRGVLNNKVDPNMDSHNLNIYELRSMVQITNDQRPIEALAMDCGYGIYPINKEKCSDAAMLSVLTSLGDKRGTLDKAIHKSLKDGVITYSEEALICDAIDASITALASFKERVERKAQDDTDRHVKAVKSHKRPTGL